MILLWSCGSAPVQAPPLLSTPVPTEAVAPADLDVTIDATRPESGRLGVVLRWSGLETGDLAFARRGIASEAKVQQLRVEDDAGHALRFETDAGVVRLLEPAPAVVVLRYEVAPGGLGRHGHQGLVTSRFATWDGRILYEPRTAAPLGRVRFRFELPEGWRVAGPLDAGADGWADLGPVGDADARRAWFHTMCFGVGPFTVATERLGRTEVRSFVHPDLEDELEARITRETFATFRAFHERLGFDPGFPLAYVRFPTVDEEPIFGGTSARGACFEGEKPGAPGLDTRLLVHRFAHPYDRYPPSGWLLGDARDAWFEEGFAGWAEVTIGAAAGVMPDEGWYDRMYRAHLDVRRDHPDWPMPLAYDAFVSDDERREYLHYDAAPIAVRLLDHLLRERGGTSLEAVSRALHARWGGQRGRLPLRAAIDELGHASYADYWAAVADGPGGWLAPTWPGFVDEAMRAAGSPVAWSGEVPVTADYLFHLASSGDFDRWDDLLVFVAAEGPRRAELRAHGITLAHAEVLAAIAGIPPAARYELARLEAGWPLHLVAATVPPRPVPLRWADDHPDVATLRALIAAEARYDEARGRTTQVAWIALKVGPKEVAASRPASLALPRDQRGLFVTRWLSPPSAAVAELVVDGAVRLTRAVRLDPRQDEVAFGFHPADRPTDPGILVFRVGPPGGPAIERWCWQR